MGRSSVLTAEAAVTEEEQLLVVAIGDSRRVALPLDAVIRLELMPADRVELVGHREVIQYRGELLPLTRLDRVLGAFSGDDPEEMLVIVVRGARGEQLAVVVTEIIDIVEHEADKRSELDDTGLIGSTVLSGRVTELLDVESLIESTVPAGERVGLDAEMVGI